MNEDQKLKAMEMAEEAREKDLHRPTFAGQLFMGTFAPSFLFPFPKQDEEDKKVGDAFIERLAVFLEENLDPNEVDATREIPRKVREEMANMGVFAMKVPKEYGGLGFSVTNYNRTVMKVASYCGSTAVLISAHQSIGVPQPLKMFGTEEQKKKYFPMFREGKISAFALTEPEAGSDPAKMSSFAELSPDGKHYTLNGTKLWCTNGTIADVIVVIAKTAPAIVQGKKKEQISAFILEMDTPGIEVTQRCEFMGLNGIYNGVLTFKDVKIPAENIIGKEGRGLAMALATINIGRLTLPAACSGVAKQCLSIARRWGTGRIQWGQPVGLHEAGREKIAYISATTFAMEALSWLTSAWADREAMDIRIEAGMTKLFCTESLWKITDLTVQLLGGRGYEKARSLLARGECGYPIERAMRDCRINRILEGSSEIMHLFLARETMDPHLKNIKSLSRNLTKTRLLAKLASLLGRYSVWYTGQWVKSWIHASYKELGPLAKHFRFCERKSHQLARTLFYYMARYRKNLEKKQIILRRLMEIGTELFAMSATCSYAISRQKEQPNDTSPITIAQYFCSMATRRITHRFRSLTDNDDPMANHLAKCVIDKEMTWLEEGIIWIGPKE
ncbi:MAG: acyl-CoA dehydrogenase family protein [Waddliaceae bacterium]